MGPDGKVYGPIFNIEQFAKDHNVNSSIFPNIVSGRTRYSNGWSLYDGTMNKPIEKNSKSYKINLISPEGDIFGPINNLAKFCKNNNLPISSIRNLINGKIKKKSFKGWILIQ